MLSSLDTKEKLEYFGAQIQRQIVVTIHEM